MWSRGCSSVERQLAFYAREPKFEPQHCVSQAWWHSHRPRTWDVGGELGDQGLGTLKDKVINKKQKTMIWMVRPSEIDFQELRCNQFCSWATHKEKMPWAKSHPKGAVPSRALSSCGCQCRLAHSGLGGRWLVCPGGWDSCLHSQGPPLWDSVLWPAETDIRTQSRLVPFFLGQNLLQVT